MIMSLSEIDGISDCETLSTDDVISNLGTDFEAFSENETLLSDDVSLLSDDVSLSSDDVSLSSDFLYTYIDDLYTNTNFDMDSTDTSDKSNIADKSSIDDLDADTVFNTDFNTTDDSDNTDTNTDTLSLDVSDTDINTDTSSSDTDLLSPEDLETANNFKTILSVDCYSNTDLMTLSTDNLYTGVLFNDLHEQTILIFAIHICVCILYYWFR